VRLTQSQANTFKTASIRHFGSGVRVWLFGSRVDDNLRGGDYDFYIETSVKDASQVIESKIKLLAELHTTPEFADEKIDLVIRPNFDELVELPIYRIAKLEGIEL
jgi:predicted nucleotidyltransferase